MYDVHDDVIKWKHFPRYCPFVRGIHRWPVNSPHKAQWRGALMFSLICALNKRLSKQSWGWWFETPSRSSWRHCNVQKSSFPPVVWCSPNLMQHIIRTFGWLGPRFNIKMVFGIPYWYDQMMVFWHERPLDVFFARSKQGSAEIKLTFDFGIEKNIGIHDLSQIKLPFKCVSCSFS